MNYPALLATFAVATLTFSACKDKTSPVASGSTDSASVAVDSQTVDTASAVNDFALKPYKKKVKTKHFNYDVEILLAESQSNPTLARAINEWVNEQLGGKYTGNLTDGEAMIQNYLKRWQKDEEQDIDNGEMNYDFEKVYETDDIITLEMESYWYGGGAHGGATRVGATFRKSDGRKLDKSMLNNDSNLNRLLVNGLMKAFEVKTRRDLAEQLMISSLDDMTDVEEKLALLPLPETQPWLTKKGLELVYQPYEIGPYAVGMPTVTIAFKHLPGVLNSTGQTFLKK